MKKQKGITLIALVITVIVLLILVGITFKLLGNDGIIAKAKWSAYVTEYESVDEAKEMYASEQYMNQYGETFKETIKKYQVASINGALAKSKDIPKKELYPVSEKMHVSTISETLKNTIMQLENIAEDEMTDENKVNLYKVDFSKIEVKATKQYAINIVSGMLYSIETEEYKGNVYHTPRLGVIKSSKMDKVGTYEMIVDAGQVVIWDSIEIKFNKKVEGSLTCKAYTSTDETIWKQIDLNLGEETNKEEKYNIENVENTRYLKVEVTIQDVNGQNSEVDYVLVNFYKFQDIGVEPEVTTEGTVEKIEDVWMIPTTSNGQTEAKGTATIAQTVTVPTEEGDYILDIEKIYGNPPIQVTITNPGGTIQELPYAPNLTVPAGASVQVTTTLNAGDGIGKVTVKRKIQQ